MVKILGGQWVTRRVWKITDRGLIAVTDDKNYERLSSGKDAPWPVAFYPDDVMVLEFEADA